MTTITRSIVRIIVFILCFCSIYGTSNSFAAVVGDIDSDGQITLVESIYALRVTSGLTTPIPDTICYTPGLADCGGDCVDTANNPDFCGNCDTGCNPGSFCSAGVCKAPTGTPCTQDNQCVSERCLEGFCMALKKVFLTSQTYTGNLGGLSGADEKCQMLASTAGLPGNYMAWLSDGSVSPTTRFTQVGGRYILTNNVVVAYSWADLTDGSIKYINIDENTSEVVEGAYVWTNTKTDGDLYSSTDTNTCNDFTVDSDSHTGVVGVSVQPFTYWTMFNNHPCDQVAHLYCFEQ